MTELAINIITLPKNWARTNWRRFLMRFHLPERS